MALEVCTSRKANEAKHVLLGHRECHPQHNPICFTCLPTEKKKNSFGDLCHKRKHAQFPLKGYSNMECLDLHEKKPGGRHRAGRES